MSKEEIEMMLAAASGWVGYKEKSVKNYAAYEDFDARAGKGNYTRFGRIADVVLSGQDRRVKDGYPWCAMFILAVLYEMKAGRQDCSVPAGTMKVDEEARQWVADVVNGGKPLTYFAGCQAWLTAAKYRRHVCVNPADGDFVVYLDSEGKPYHIGIVESVNAAAGTFVSIEGNTSAIGDNIEPNGGAVSRKNRKKSKATVFIQNNFISLRR